MSGMDMTITSWHKYIVWFGQIGQFLSPQMLIVVDDEGVKGNVQDVGYDDGPEGSTINLLQIYHMNIIFSLLQGSCGQVT